jgi:hypothetical protein
MASSTGQLVPNGKQQFLDSNGSPLAGGFVYHYVPGTTTPSPTYVDPGLTVLNTNPIILDAAGRAIIWAPDGTLFRQVVTDQFGNFVWDQQTGYILSDIQADSLEVTGNVTAGGTVQGADLVSTGPASVAGTLTANNATLTTSLGVGSIGTSGDVIVGGQLSASRVQLSSDFALFLSGGNPTINFASPDTFLFYDVADSSIGVTVGGTEIFTFRTSGIVAEAMPFFIGGSSQFYLNDVSGMPAVNFVANTYMQWTGTALVLVVGGNPIIEMNGAGIGFLGAGPQGIQTITGSRSGATATVLENLLSALQTFGLIIDSTTA